MLAGSVSLALHGGLLASVAIVVAIRGQLAEHAPRVAYTSVEIVSAAAPVLPPAPRAAPPSVRPAAVRASAEARGRREPAQRSQPSAPVVSETLADLEVHYDDPDNFAGDTAAAAGSESRGRRSGIGGSIGSQAEGGLATMAIPTPSPVSLARPPRPKHDYTKLYLRAASKFAGKTIKVVLTVDATGRVRAVQLIEGVDRDLDRRTIALVNAFEFQPALDDNGEAIQGTSRWNIEIIEDESEPFKAAIERGHY
jgi:hypothetical protein